MDVEKQLVVLADFESGCSIDSPGSGMEFGNFSLDYRAPELIQDYTLVGPECDVWSVGCVCSWRC